MLWTGSKESLALAPFAPIGFPPVAIRIGPTGDVANGKVGAQA